MACDALVHELASELRSGQIDDLLKARTASESAMGGVLGYLHPNGFVKVVIGNLASGSSLRLHLWPANGEHGDVHSHRWNFSSLVLEGVLESRDYATGPGSSHAKYRCTPDHESKLYNFDFLEHVEVRMRWSRQRGPGELYEQPLHALHSAAAGGGQAAMTLVLQGKAKVASSIVISEQGRVMDAGPVTQMSGPQMQEELEKLRERLPRT